MKITRDWRRHADQSFFLDRLMGMTAARKGRDAMADRDYARFVNAANFKMEDPIINGKIRLDTRRIYVNRKPQKYRVDNHAVTSTGWYPVIIIGRGSFDTTTGYDEYYSGIRI